MSAPYGHDGTFHLPNYLISVSSRITAVGGWRLNSRWGKIKYYPPQSLLVLPMESLFQFLDIARWLGAAGASYWIHELSEVSDRMIIGLELNSKPLWGVGVLYA